MKSRGILVQAGMGPGFRRDDAICLFRLRHLTLYFLFLCSIWGAAQAGDSKPSVTAVGLTSFSLAPTQTSFGALEWRGGLKLTSEDPRFGGLSGLALSEDGGRLLAVSDRGYWFRAKLSYSNGALSGLQAPEIAPFPDSGGRPPGVKSWRDAEALAAWQPGNIDGKVIVGFETRARIGIYDLAKRGLAARLQVLKIPEDIAKGPRNGELEALARFASGPLKGRVLAVAEQNFDPQGNIRAWIIGPHGFAFAIARHADYVVTDAAVLPGGDVLTLERSFGASLLPGMAIRRFPGSAIQPRTIVTPKILFEGRAPYYAIDNMEGLAVSKGSGGETRITIVSDDNYNRILQRTLLLQFALPDK